MAKRIEFDTTVDELVDVNMRLLEHTSAYGQQRKQAQWAWAVIAAGGAAVFLLRGTAVPSYGALAIAGVGALLSGLAVGSLQGRYYERYVRQHYRRVVNELYGEAPLTHWEFEIRPDTLWCRSEHSEVAFPWSRLRRVEDVPGAIELWFDPGLAVVRDRAFSAPEERRAFFDTVTKYLPNAREI